MKSILPLSSKEWRENLKARIWDSDLQDFETVTWDRDLQAERQKGEDFCHLPAITKSSFRMEWGQEPAPSPTAALLVVKPPGHWEFWPKPSPSISTTEWLIMGGGGMGGGTREHQIFFLPVKFPSGAIWHPQRSAGSAQEGLGYRNPCSLLPYSCGFNVVHGLFLRVWES